MALLFFFARHIVWNIYGMTRDYRSPMLSERFIVKYKQETVFLITANIPRKVHVQAYS